MNFSKNLFYTAFFLAVFAFFPKETLSQPQLTVPQLSQKASVTQTIGLTDISIDYHRPLVKGRKIWGGLVPYNEVWRAGANENTTISFTDNVKINGKDLPAGKYGLHMIPTENEWTVILSRDNAAWGSFFYNADHDALRIKVKPQTADFVEALTYSFTDPTANSVEVNLHWEKLNVSFKVDVDVKNVVLASIRKELTGLAGFYWQPFNQAAAYCLQNDINLDEGMKWADKSISISKTFSNLRVKAGLLNKLGKTEEASKLIDAAWKVATENEINLLGYQYLNVQNYDKAIETFKMNIEKHPDSWNVYDSLAEAYAKSGNKELALRNYEKALNMTDDQVQKDRITKTIQSLQ
jgi:tetratricopeptide (TPR) repeat protein